MFIYSEERNLSEPEARRGIYGPKGGIGIRKCTYNMS